MYISCLRMLPMLLQSSSLILCAASNSVSVSNITWVFSTEKWSLRVHLCYCMNSPVFKRETPKDGGGSAYSGYTQTHFVFLRHGLCCAPVQINFPECLISSCLFTCSDTCCPETPPLPGSAPTLTSLPVFSIFGSFACFAFEFLFTSVLGAPPHLLKMI